MRVLLQVISLVLTGLALIEEGTATKAGCGPTNYNGATGTITSPNYPSNYINNAMCVWTIRAPPGTQTLSFKFASAFSIEDDTACSYDFVTVYSEGHTFNHVHPMFNCGSQEYLTTDNGVIDSHGGHASYLHYGKYMNCSWTIEAPAGKYVEVWAQSFDLEDYPSCSFDFLELLDGNSLNSKSMGKFCGSSMNPISSTQHCLTLHFVTDGYTQQMGFRIHYNFTDIIVHTCHASQFHCNNSKCVSASFRCDNDDDCGDASDEQGCSGLIPGVNVTAAACAADMFQCLDKSGCVLRDWLCDGDDDCPDASDEQTLHCLSPAITSRPTIHIPVNSAGCGQLNYTGTSGTIKSPNYPSNYINNAMCVWTIQAPPGTQTLAFQFDPLFDIEHNEDETACSYDFVDVYSDGHNLHQGPFCGNAAPGQFTMPGSRAYVEFTSDDSDTFQGFKVDWKAL